MRSRHLLLSPLAAVTSLAAALGLPACVGADDAGDASADPTARRAPGHHDHGDQGDHGDHPMRNPSGSSSSVSSAGRIALEGGFFTDFGTNGRTCVTCHDPGEGWGIAVRTLAERFDDSDGLDPLFRPVDGASSPLADVSTVAARRAAYAMLLHRGTIRVGIGMPAGAEFELVAVDDPYGFAGAGELSLFRRPLPSTNLGFIPAVMWDGRVAGSTVEAALLAQSNGATLGHAEADQPLTDAERAEIVAFESSLSTAQLISNVAGRLDKRGAQGGATALATQPRVAGRMTLFDGWADLAPTGNEQRARLAVVRGQALFNDKASPTGATCRGCHSVANVGTSLNPVFFDVGVSAGERRTADLPLYTVRNLATGEVRTTTDPGRALITGLWRDVNRFKAPGLRALAARAPYFHNGAAATLRDVVHHYEAALGFSFTPAEESDLVAFLTAL